MFLMNLLSILLAILIIIAVVFLIFYIGSRRKAIERNKNKKFRDELIKFLTWDIEKYDEEGEIDGGNN